MTDVALREESQTSWPDRLVRAGLVLLVLTVPLLFMPPQLMWSSEPFPWATAEVASPVKIAWAQFVIFVLFFAWLAKMNARGTFVFRPTALFWSLLVYLGVQALSLVKAWVAPKLVYVLRVYLGMQALSPVKAVNVGYGWFELRIFLF